MRAEPRQYTESPDEVIETMEQTSKKTRTDCLSVKRPVP